MFNPHKPETFSQKLKLCQILLRAQQKQNVFPTQAVDKFMELLQQPRWQLDEFEQFSINWEYVVHYFIRQFEYSSTMTNGFPKNVFEILCCYVNVTKDCLVNPINDPINTISEHDEEKALECKNRGNNYFKFCKLKMADKCNQIPKDFRFLTCQRLLEITYAAYSRSLQLNPNQHTVYSNLSGLCHLMARQRRYVKKKPMWIPEINFRNIWIFSGCNNFFVLLCDLETMLIVKNLSFIAQRH